ncbi:hypothetical protein GDO81_006780 [Engystomops pustulosus]|uniref:Uncharacterized protein n=1 Tax=Engystomops pustulosus TaxID=76066 RepID=A0AAV7CZA9_ENGPU|nr:hypothetical protein GDO81_006780 [Engystomops pustulosus]
MAGHTTHPSILQSIYHSYSKQHAIVTAAHIYIQTQAILPGGCVPPATDRPSISAPTLCNINIHANTAESTHPRPRGGCDMTKKPLVLVFYNVVLTAMVQSPGK